MGRKIIVEFEIAYPDLSRQKDIDLLEHIWRQNRSAFRSVRIVDNYYDGYTVRSPEEIDEIIERNKNDRSKK